MKLRQSGSTRQALPQSPYSRKGATFLFDRIGSAAGPYLTSADSPTYVVGSAPGTTTRIVPIAAFGPNDVREPFKDALRVRADGLGTWISDGQVYIDAVEIYSFLPTALAVARERGELAVWDAQRGEEVQVYPVAEEVQARDLADAPNVRV